MAKLLKKPQPPSSIDRMLDKSIALSVIAPIEEEQVVEPAEPTPPVTEEPIITKSAQPTKVVGEIKPAQATRPKPVPVKGEATGEPANVTREFVLTPSANKTLNELISIYEGATSADLTRSHVLRAVLMAIKTALPRIKAEAKHVGPLKRPSNAKGCEAERDEFERHIADAFMAGMKG